MALNFSSTGLKIQQTHKGIKSHIYTPQRRTHTQTHIEKTNLCKSSSSQVFFYRIAVRANFVQLLENNYLESDIA